VSARPPASGGPEEGFALRYQKSFLDILVRMARENRPGVLRSRGGSSPFEIHVDKGWVVNVTGEFPDEPSIEEIIARSGFLDARTFRRIVRRVRKSGVPFVTFVVKKGLFSEVFLKRILENVIRERLNRVMELKNFGVSFEAVAPTPLRNLSYIHLPAYLRRFRNEYDARQRVRQHMASELVYPRLRPRAPSSIEKDPRFDVDARIVYFFVNGRRSFRDIQYISGMGYTRTGTALEALVRAGLIELHRDPVAPPKTLGLVGRVVYHGLVPVALAFVLVLHVSQAPALRSFTLYDRFDAQRAQVMALFRRATEVFELSELRPPRGAEELFEVRLLPDEWRRFKRYYERALAEEARGEAR